MKILYVIGNGFDLHHQIKSSYTAFGEFVKNTDSTLHDTFEDHFAFEGNWANLEDTLANIDTDLIVDEASTFLVSYAADDWSDSGHHDYQYEVTRIVEALSSELKKSFTCWASGLEIPTASTCGVPLLNLDASGFFLNFNYTNTLQKLYGIKSSQVLHIHNQAKDQDSELILGHGINPDSISSQNSGADLEQQDTRVTEANEIIDEYFKSTYKPTEEVIKNNSAFFSSLQDIKSIYIVGHSLSNVDMPYFSKIAENINLSKVEWVVTYYNEADLSNHIKALELLSIPNTQVSHIKLSDV